MGEAVSGKGNCRRSLGIMRRFSRFYLQKNAPNARHWVRFFLQRQQEASGGRRFRFPDRAAGHFFSKYARQQRRASSATAASSTVTRRPSLTTIRPCTTVQSTGPRSPTVGQHVRGAVLPAYQLQSAAVHQKTGLHIFLLPAGRYRPVPAAVRWPRVAIFST